MRVVCVVECDRCGKSIVNDPGRVSIFLSDDITGVTVCPECNDPIFTKMDYTVAAVIAKRGVKVFSWKTGEEVLKI